MGSSSPAVRIPPAILLLLLLLLGGRGGTGEGGAQQWCIARSGASEGALQAALDYACGAGSADCEPIQQSGLCYLPNTLQAHSSYAFNSFFQRSQASPGACDFAGTATISITDPSYGSCTFPSSASTAGGSRTPTTPAFPNTNNPTTTSPATTTPTGPGIGSTIGGGGGGGLTPIGGLTPGNGLTPTTGINPGFGPALPNTDDMSSASAIMIPITLLLCGYILPLLL